MSDKRFFHVTAEGALRPQPGPSEALAAAQGGGYVWFDYQDPKREDLEALAEPLGIHPLAIDDCLDEAQIPKIEDFPGHGFMLFNAYVCGEHGIIFDEVDFMIGRGFLVTVSGHSGPGQRFPDKLGQAIALDAESVLQGPDFLLHVLLDCVVDDKCQAIESVQAELDDAEEAILKDLSAFDPDLLLRLRRQLLALRKSLFHEREVLVKICRRDSPYVGEKSIYHFRDIYDHLTKFFEEVEICREMLLGLMEMYLSMVNNRMAAAANRTNATMRRLTFIMTIFMPLTLLSGIGGMSEWSMMTGAQNWKVSYPAFMAVMVFIGTATYYILRWMEGRSAGS